MHDTFQFVKLHFDRKKDLEVLWQDISEASHFIYGAYDSSFLAVVLCPEECFFLLRLCSSEMQNNNFDDEQCLQYLIYQVFRITSLRFCEINTLTEISEVYEAYRCIYRLPIEKGYSFTAESYEYSSLRHLLSNIDFLVSDPIGFQQSNAFEILDWLNLTEKLSV